MRLSDVAMLSTRMFKTNPARTWLTIGGMGVGTGAVVTLVALGFGLQGIILEQIVLGETLLSLAVQNPPSKVITLTKENIEKLRRLENVKDVAPMASVPALITMEGLTGNTFLQGADPAYYRYTGTNVVAGEIFTDDNAAKLKDGVILTKAVLKLFAIEEPEKIIGKRVTFRAFLARDGTDEIDEIDITKEYRVIGVTNEENFIGVFMQLAEDSSNLTVTNYDRAQVRVTKVEFLDAISALILEEGFVVTALSKTVEQANKIFQGIQAVLAVFGGIALTVSAIGMFNTMTVTLLERTGEIGIMRTLGASASDIKILFISESVIVGTLGGVMGILFGLAIGGTLNGIMNVAASNFGGKSVSLFRFPMPFLVFITVFSGVVGFLTGVFPARRAAKLDPLDAIRYK